MSHVPRTARAYPQRQALGRRIRAYRLALGLTIRDLAAHTTCGHGQMGRVENAGQDVFAGTLIEVAEAVGLEVALVAAHHLPLLDLTAAEVDEVIDALSLCVSEYGGDPAGPMCSALDKLTTSTEETQP